MAEITANVKEKRLFQPHPQCSKAAPVQTSGTVRTHWRRSDSGHRCKGDLRHGRRRPDLVRSAQPVPGGDADYGQQRAGFAADQGGHAHRGVYESRGTPLDLAE